MLAYHLTSPPLSSRSSWFAALAFQDYEERLAKLQADFSAERESKAKLQQDIAALRASYDSKLSGLETNKTSRGRSSPKNGESECLSTATDELSREQGMLGRLGNWALQQIAIFHETMIWKHVDCTSALNIPYQYITHEEMKYE